MKSLYKYAIGITFYTLLYIFTHIWVDEKYSGTKYIVAANFFIFVIAQIILNIDPKQKRKLVSTALLAISLKYLLTMAVLLGIIYFYGKGAVIVWSIFGIGYLFNTLLSR